MPPFPPWGTQRSDNPRTINTAIVAVVTVVRQVCGL